MDLYDLKVDTSRYATLELVHPATGVALTHEGHPVVLHVQSPHASAMRELSRRVQNARLKAARRTGRIQLTAEELEQEMIDRLALAIVGWENLHAHGSPLPYSPQAAVQLMTDFAWMRDQVSAFLDDEGNFLSPTTTL